MSKLNTVHVFNNDVTKAYTTSVSTQSNLKSVSDYFIGSLGQGLCFIDNNNGTCEFSGVVNFRNLQRFNLTSTYELMTGKKPYNVTFSGREIGAIGLSYSYSIVVLARNEEEARIRIYDTHDHCMGVQVKEIKYEY